MEFSRQEYCSGLPFPSPVIFPTQGSNPRLLHCRQIFTIWETTREVLHNFQWLTLWFYLTFNFTSSFFHYAEILYFYVIMFISTAAAAKSLQSCPTLCDPIDGIPPGYPVPGILQARTLEWVAISFSNTWKWKVKVKSLSRARLPATPWTAAHQAPPSVGFSRQEYWSGVPLPSLVY